jgi:hypothetical protein
MEFSELFLSLPQMKMFVGMGGKLVEKIDVVVNCCDEAQTFLIIKSLLKF